MKSRRTATEITIETDQVLVIRRRQITRSWCSECGTESEFVPLGEVNRLLDTRKLDDRKLGDRKDNRKNEPGAPATGGAHFAKSSDGSVVICVKSLLGLNDVFVRVDTAPVPRETRREPRS